MARKRSIIYLYLALACFLGIIAIFIFGGYMGVYETLNVTVGEQTMTVDPDFWLQRGNFWSTGINWGGKAFFRYEIENRQFSSHTDDINVSLWQNQQKLRDLLSTDMVIESFGKNQVEWVVDTAEFLPSEMPPSEQSRQYQFTMVIKRNDTERRIILYVNPYISPPIAPKPVLPPTR